MIDNGDWEALMRMTRAQLRDCATHCYKRGGGTEPDVLLVSRGCAAAVFKDYSRASGCFGRVVAPVMLWREASALAALDDLTGVPRLYRRVDARGVLIEHCPGQPWASAHAGDAAYDRLERLVAAMHERGIAHADLRGGGNILVDDDDRPYLVDFVSRVRRGAVWNRPWNWIFRQFVAADKSALAKLRIRHARHLATQTDYARWQPATPVAHMARWVGQSIRRGVRFFANR